jgi:Patatin-like phospholipase
METRGRMQFKSYPSEGSSDLFKPARIWQVARATSAAPSFFDPIQIGRVGEWFNDGGTSANNPVETIWIEAQRSLPLRKSLEKNFKCLVSIGRGIRSQEPFGNNLRAVAKTLIAIATDTENRAKKFESAHSDLTERCQ